MDKRRLFEFVVAISGLMALMPVMLIIVLLIVMEDGGPIFFIQSRLGKGLKPFYVLKFRSMCDGQVTRTGRWIRATGLDELLQFFNVLNGSMSLVGPRPLTRADVRRLGWFDIHSPRFQLRPGITGLSQLYAGKGKRVTTFLENYYARERSMLLDCKIIFLSFLVNILGKKAVQHWLQEKRCCVRAARRCHRY